MKLKIPENHTRRTVSKFLIIPLRLGNETRWLELANIEQFYHNGDWVFYSPHRGSGWIHDRFV